MDDIDRLTESVEAFCRLIASLPEPALAEQPWGPKEVLAHLAYHHETYVRQAAARAAGAPFTPTSARWIEVNAQAAAESKGVPVPELLRRLRESQRQLAAIYRTCDPGSITMILKQGSKRRTLATLVPEVESHFRSHYRQLRPAIPGGRRPALQPSSDPFDRTERSDRPDPSDKEAFA